MLSFARLEAKVCFGFGMGGGVVALGRCTSEGGALGARRTL